METNHRLWTIDAGPILRLLDILEPLEQSIYDQETNSFALVFQCQRILWPALKRDDLLI